jgi:hypothetical protein
VLGVLRGAVVNLAQDAQACSGELLRVLRVAEGCSGCSGELLRVLRFLRQVD